MSIPTVTLETAKRLKEAGMPQETLLQWMFIEEPNRGLIREYGREGGYSLVVTSRSNVFQPWFAAYTAGELMEWFLEQFGTERWQLEVWPMDYGWEAGIMMWNERERSYQNPPEEGADNPAEALGLLAIQILESQTTEAT